MRRRDFVLGAASVAGAFYTGQVRAQTPCPPGLSGANSPDNCPMPQGAASLSAAAAQLNPGQHSPDPITWNPNNDVWDISWQNRTAFWDDMRRELQYMGKPQASAGGLTRQAHWIYSEETDTWRETSTTIAPGHYGHVWGVTFDHTNDIGDYYYTPQDPLTSDNSGYSIYKMDRSVEDGQGSTNSPWGLVTPLADFEIWTPQADDIYQGSPCYHPNLLGPGRPGIFAWAVNAFSYFDVNNQEWVRNSIFGSGPYFLRDGNAACYIPGKDIAVFGDGSRAGYGQDGVYTIVRAGEAANTAPDQVTGPISVNVGSGNHGKILVDPRDDGTIMLLESMGNRVWTNSNGGATADWVLESFTHPFWNNNPYKMPSDGGGWTCCSVPRYGCVLGLASYADGGGSMLWRPG